MTRRTYAGGAVPTTLSSSLDNVSLTASAVSFVGWPDGVAGPFIATIDRDTANEEKVLCSSAVSGTLTISQRGYDGTTAHSHSVGAIVEHTIGAIDLDEANLHVNAISAVHGLSAPDGTFVATAKTQTLTNKTLTAPTITGGTVNPTTLQKGGVNVPTISETATLTNKTLTSPVITTPTINGAGGALALPAGPDTLVGRATTDTLTNKTLTAPVIATITNGGTLTLPGGPDTLVARTSADTLTNKTLTSPVITTPIISGSGGQLTLPAGPDTLVGITTTQTLQNKSISGLQNTLTNIGIGSLSNVAVAQAPSTLVQRDGSGGIAAAYLIAGSVAQPRIASGTASVTFTAGAGTLTYGSLGFTPSRVIVTTGMGASPVVIGVTGVPGATSVALGAWATAALTAYTGGLASVHWIAVE